MTEITALITAMQGDPNDFRDLLEESLKADVPDEKLDELDNHLLELSWNDPSRVVNLAEIAAHLYAKYDRKIMQAYALNTLTATLVDTREARRFILHLRAAVQFVIEHDLFFPGKSVIANAERALNKDLLDVDEYIVVLREMTKFYVHFEQIPEATDTYCRAAMYLSQVGAFQPAYRILKDADVMVRESKSVYELPKVLAAHATVASDENDLTYAEEHFLKATKLLQELGQRVPEEYLLNLATIQMQLEKFEEGAATFERVLKDTEAKGDHKFVAAMNLAVCKRTLGKPDALDEIKRARTFLSEETIVEAAIEFELIACKSYLKEKLYEDARVSLAAAVELLDQELLQISRLHYRRGFRERYVQRVTSLACEMPDEGNVKNILCWLAFVKSSSFSDWMCMLDWYEAAIGDEKLAPELRERLVASLQRVLQLGAPVLYGYREKYEDAFESPETPHTESLRLPNFNVIWREFNLAIREVCQSTGLPPPFEKASAKNIARMLEAQLQQQSCLLVILNTDGFCHLIMMLGTEYRRVSMPHQEFWNFYASLCEYQDKAINLGELRFALRRTTNQLASAMRTYFDLIHDRRPVEIVVLPDPISDMIPIVPVILSEPRMRDLMSKASLQLRYCPVLHKGKSEESTDKLMGVWDSSEGLPLAHEELKTIQRLINPSESQLLDLNSLEPGKTAAEEMVNHGRRCGYLHLASHGAPISNFTDPYFASIRGKDMDSDSLSVPLVQEHFWTFPYSLAVLNACHSSVTTSHNYQRQFRTNEVINYATLLLLNRRSWIIAAQWTTFDLPAYFFATIFYKHLQEGASFLSAYVRAILQMYDADKNAIIDALTNIQDANLREQKIAIVKQSREEHPFRDEYCYGAYLIHSLL